MSDRREELRTFLLVQVMCAMWVIVLCQLSQCFGGGK